MLNRNIINFYFLLCCLLLKFILAFKDLNVSFKWWLHPSIVFITKFVWTVNSFYVCF